MQSTFALLSALRVVYPKFSLLFGIGKMVLKWSHGEQYLYNVVIMSALKSFQLLPYLSWEACYIFLHLIKPNSQEDPAHTWVTINSTIITLMPCIMISSYRIWGAGVVLLTFICRQCFLMHGWSEQRCGVHMPSLCSPISLLFRLLLKMYENKSIAERDSPATEFYVPVLWRKEFFVGFI